MGFPPGSIQSAYTAPAGSTRGSMDAHATKSPRVWIPGHGPGLCPGAGSGLKAHGSSPATGTETDASTQTEIVLIAVSGVRAGTAWAGFIPRRSAADRRAAGKGYNLLGRCLPASRGFLDKAQQRSPSSPYERAFAAGARRGRGSLRLRRPGAANRDCCGTAARARLQRLPVGEPGRCQALRQDLSPARKRSRRRRCGRRHSLNFIRLAQAPDILLT
jgi:hypothetical protein